jgi:hypothetical protein
MGDREGRNKGWGAFVILPKNSRRRKIATERNETTWEQEHVSWQEGNANKS